MGDLSVSITLASLFLSIQDDGSGFDMLKEGFGVEGMKERIEVLRGTFHIDSEVYKGTKVYCEIPVGV